MKTPRSIQQMQLQRALNALQVAILEGATHDYERLVNLAMGLGASEDELDLLIHDSLEAMFFSAEQPVTRREVAHFSMLVSELEFA